MKIGIFNFTKPTEGSTVASNRIARFISERMAVPIYHDESIAAVKLDTIIIVNGAFAFCSCLEALAKAIINTPTLIWVQNDYTIVPPKDQSEAQSPFRKAFVIRRQKRLDPMHYWTTVMANAKRTPLSRYINWNQLTYEPMRLDARQSYEKNMFYYGAFRQQRIDAFDHFFMNPSNAFDTVVSSTSKKFKERYGKFIEVVPGIPRELFYGELRKQGVGLYIEDKKSHTEFHSPANRFYEMLSAGLPMLFQLESVDMLAAAGIDNIGKYTIAETSQAKVALKYRNSMAMDQRKLWGGRNYLQELESEVAKARKALLRS